MMAPPVSVTLEAVKLGVPLQPVPVTAPTPVTVRPAGKLSVKARLLCAGLPVPLLMLKVRVLDEPAAIEPAE